MTKYFLRAEAINLAAVMDDTSQVSVIRGSGLLCLDAPKAVEEWLRKSVSGATTLSLGASTGLFSFDAPDDAAAAKVRVGAEALLRTDGFRHFTFAVDVTREAGPGSWAPEREALLAQVRWRQMVSPSLAIPGRGGTTNGPCSTDKLRPATRTWGKEAVSESVRDRIDYGRAQRQAVFTRIAPGADPVLKGGGLSFTDDLKTLAERHEGKPSDGKIAVIYVDGNEFGKKQTGLCRTPGDQATWDSEIRGGRQVWLEAFLADAATDGGFKTATTPPKLRIEVLMWGGDELLLVVPAWRGWKTVASFYSHAVAWPVPLATDGSRLTHAAGVVFCHDKAPLTHVCRLAKSLCKAVKEGKGGRNRNLVAYEVLEAFDHVGPDFEGHRARRAGPLPQEALLLDGEKVAAALANAGSVLDAYPRKKLYEAVAAFYGNDEKKAFEIAERGRRELDEAQKASLDALLDALGGGGGFGPWLHLAESWDYLEG